MKVLSTFILLAIFFTTRAQDQVEFETRKVLPMAAMLWKKAYDDLKTQEYIGTSAMSDVSQRYFFSKQQIAVLKGRSTDTDTVIFYIYLDADDLPCFAMANIQDTTQLLVYKDSASVIMPSSNYTTNVSDWEAYLTSNDSTMAYVTSYILPWSSIGEIMGDKQNIQVEPVVHVVSPYDDNYQVMNQSHEGFIAIDLLLIGTNESPTDNLGTVYTVPNKGKYYDFAMPCPKNCP